MKSRKTFPLALSFAIAFGAVHSTGASFAQEEAVGIDKRVPWTTSRVKGSPEPPLPFVTERAFPKLKFNQCLDLAKPPGSDRFFIAEQGGKIYSFVDRPDTAEADLVVDIRKSIPGANNVYAIAFHPKFQQNRYCYVCYIVGSGKEDGSHVARFTVSKTDPPTIDPASELTLLTWLSGGHNGCCLKFGPDGCLYVSTGDATSPSPPDRLRAGQDVSNLLSSILRIDVDHADNGKNYRIPPDNPFVDLEGARPEIWAYGFRNPWRMSFDQETGDLWVGDVGWELWEMLDRVERGGNYGWSVMEGRQLTLPEAKRGPTPILPPTIDHPHSESSSITDGLTYYGSRLKELHGTHIYGDYDTGKFWAFRWADGKVVEHREIADTTLRIVGFGASDDGEFYILDHPAGTIHRMIPNPRRAEKSSFPLRLSESGLFSDTPSQSPAAGVIGYSINAEPWADHAVAERFVATLGTGSIQASGSTYAFPKDSVLVKTLSLEMTRGDASTRRRVETQLLHYDGIDWQPYTYRWNDEQTDAMLVGAAGAEQVFEVTDDAAPEGRRRHVWRFAGRAECQRCHNKWSGPPLAFNTPQLNKAHKYSKQAASQLATLSHIKLLEKLPKPESRPKLADPRSDASVTERARAYLQANCAHCHRRHAGSSVLSYLHYDLSLEDMHVAGARPTQGVFGIHNAQVVTPGDPYRSVLYYRMAKLGSGRMPHIGSTEVDEAGVALIRDWIAGLGDSGKADEVTAAQRKREAALLTQLRKRPRAKPQAVKQLLGSTSGALRLLEAVGSLPDEQKQLVVNTAAKHGDVQVRDLFERFLPQDKRVKRLGSVVAADRILALKGDAKRGEKVFFATSGVQCKGCHKIGERGSEVGPPLSSIGKKLRRPELLESILLPSKSIDPKFVSYLAETNDGRLHVGLLVRRDGKEVVLKDAQNKEIRLPAADVERLVPQGKSLMPELLLRDMTAQQVADLLEYLASLK